jgi:hypothetical protein
MDLSLVQKLMAKQQSITSLPRSPDDDRKARMIKYSITMGIRLLCIIVCFLVPGYWVIIPAVGAIVLPYVAVVLANVSTGRPTELMRPDQLALPPADDKRDTP